MVAPNTIRIRMYTVGFGDCFLVTFGYPQAVDGRAERHMLIDFGSKDYAPGGPKLRDVAGFIAADCGGKLDVVVVSHRHKDHLAGFVPTIGGDTIAALQPDAVVRSWTEDPGLPAEAPPSADAFALDIRHVRSLDAGQRLFGAIGAVALPARPTDLRRGLRDVALYEGPNQDAVDRLGELSEGGRGRYASFGTDLDLDAILPGVSVEVIGPPLPSAWEPIRSQASDDPEFWLRLADTLPPTIDAATPPMLGDDADGGVDEVEIGPLRWVIERVERGRLQAALRIARWLDGALNNTSVILLIEAAGRRMLFPGDAQIENWSYVLSGRPDSPHWLDRLAGVDLYKVSHHGSRNATPKLSLYPRWRTAADAGARMLSVMSTLSGTHDEIHPVPSDALLTALAEAPMRLVSSQPPDNGPTAPFTDIVAGPGPEPSAAV
jgi:hypothetical protein